MNHPCGGSENVLISNPPSNNLMMLSPTSPTDTVPNATVTSDMNSNSGLPFAQINVKSQSRQKVLKLNPPSYPLSTTFSTLLPFTGNSQHSTGHSHPPNFTKYATIGLIECFTSCDPSFCYDKNLNPRRVLTKPSRPVHNNGHDNEKWDYILYVNDIIGNEEGRKYVILDLLGQGTFGQVVKCMNLKTRELCAVKVIKNQPAYFNQSMMEVTVLEMLNQKYDRDDRRHIVRMKDTFIFRQHLCIVAELLSLNLYELIKQNGYRGFSLGLCRVFLAQVLDSLTVLKEARIIHCDLKPENILLKSLEAPIIKVIDYGSACHEHQTVYTYIQSRFYRSPEIILGLPYTSSIDMWSVGCIAAELFLGLPIFPGCSNYDQINRIVESLGVPPYHMLEMGKESLTYFDKFPNQPTNRAYALKTRERYSFETGRAEAVPKKYFASTAFPQIILNYPMRPSSKDMSMSEKEAEMGNRRCFSDFVGGLLNLNPLERWNPYQAMQHPFITGRPFTGPFQPTLLPLLTHVSAAAAPPQLQSPTVVPTAATTATRQRPRSNTLSTLTFQDVPPQLQRLAAVSKAQSDKPPAPASQRTVPETSAVSNYEIFSERRNSQQQQQLQEQQLSHQFDGIPTQSQFHAQTQTLTTQNQIQSQQKLSAYMTNRRVSNPPGMNVYNQQQSRNSNSNNNNTVPASSSLPTSTGFFYYNNIINPQTSQTQTQAQPQMGGNRRNSITRSSQLSTSSTSLSDGTSTTTSFLGNEQRRGSYAPMMSSSGSFGAIHRIDEDTDMTTTTSKHRNEEGAYFCNDMDYDLDLNADEDVNDCNCESLSEYDGEEDADESYCEIEIGNRSGNFPNEDQCIIIKNDNDTDDKNTKRHRKRT